MQNFFLIIIKSKQFINKENNKILFHEINTTAILKEGQEKKTNKIIKIQRVVTILFLIVNIIMNIIIVNFIIYGKILHFSFFFYEEKCHKYLNFILLKIQNTYITAVDLHYEAHLYKNSYSLSKSNYLKWYQCSKINNNVAKNIKLWHGNSIS